MNSITTALLEHSFLTSGPQSESIDSFYWGRRFWFCSLPVLSILTWIQSRYSCFSRPETGCWFSSVGWAIHRVQLLTHRAKPDAAHLYVVFAGSRIAQGQSPTRFCPCIFYAECNELIFSVAPGLNDREGRGRWEWAGGEPVGYTNWRKMPLQPKKKESRKCVLVWRRAKWQIRECKTSRGHRFVCSVKIWVQHRPVQRGPAAVSCHCAWQKFTTCLQLTREKRAWCPNTVHVGLIFTVQVLQVLQWRCPWGLNQLLSLCLNHSY